MLLESRPPIKIVNLLFTMTQHRNLLPAQITHRPDVKTNRFSQPACTSRWILAILGAIQGAEKGELIPLWQIPHF